MNRDTPLGDHSKLKDYLREWSKTKVLVLLTLFVDLL